MGVDDAVRVATRGSDDARFFPSATVAQLQAIYQYSPKIELSGAIRRNKWSGAYAVVALDGPPVQFNFPFNVDWGGTLNGVANPGYAARSTDFALGARYRMDKWTFSTGLVYIGKASTSNPSAARLTPQRFLAAPSGKSSPNTRW